MSPLLITFLILAYFGLLILISFITVKDDSNDSFFLANRKSPWYVIAFGMIGTTISGVTFISVPGWVGTSQFSYMQMVLGYLLGYSVIAFVLLPLYYRLNLTSIYTYLGQRFGFWSYKTGAFYFLLSRTIGSAFRLYIVAIVLQIAVFDAWDVPFALTVFITIALIWVYTFKGGIKTIIWTDILQTFFLLFAVAISVVMISSELNFSFSSMVHAISDSSYSQIFFWDMNDKKFFFKQFFSGAFIAIVMTGLDQDMMQKNLTCRSLRDSQKNMLSYASVLVFINLLFLSLGALLYMYADAKGIAHPLKTDELYPMLATQNYLHPLIGIFFIIGLVAAAYSSADSALAALTTSFCIDILDMSKLSEQQRVRIRKLVHIGISVLMILVILIFKAINDESVISAVFTAAGYTYGPLLGLFAFGLFTKRNVKDRLVPLVCLLSPIVCYVLNNWSDILMNGYKFGFELLILNGLLTFTGLLLLKRK